MSNQAFPIVEPVYLIGLPGYEKFPSIYCALSLAEVIGIKLVTLSDEHEPVLCYHVIYQNQTEDFKRIDNSLYTIGDKDTLSAMIDNYQSKINSL